MQSLVASFTPALVGLAGLADGFNPCAFATIIFLTTVLTLGGRSGRSVMAGGFAFCLASFATYYAMGLGLLAGLDSLKGFTGLRSAVEWGAVAALEQFVEADFQGDAGHVVEVEMELDDCITLSGEHPICHPATEDGNQPRVRPLRLWIADTRGFYWMMANSSPSYRAT